MDHGLQKNGDISTVKQGKEEESLTCVEEPDGISNEKERWECVTSCTKTGNKFRTDVIYQDKLVYTVCLFAAFFIVGWSKGQLGPAYMDVRIISNTNFEQGSWILTSFFIGWSFGCAFQGVLHDKVNQKLMYSISLFVWSIIIAGIPWCSLFEAMVFSYMMIGILQGILDTGGNTEILRVWEEKGRTAIVRLNLIFALGSVLSPLFVAPFLMDTSSDRNTINSTSNDSNNTEHDISILMNQSTILENDANKESGYRGLPSSEMNTLRSNDSYLISNERNLTTNQFLDQMFTPKSQIYIPFSVIAAVSLLAGLMFLLSYVFYSKEKVSKTKKENLPSKCRELSTPLKICTVSLISSIFFVYFGIDEAYTAFLSTYCVEQFHWSKQDGAFLTSLVFIFVLIARLLIVLFDRLIDTRVIIGFNFVLMLTSIVGLLIISLYKFDIAAWFFCPLFGLSKSCLFALLFSWSNEYITPMTGHISACYCVTSVLGCILNPILLGVLMKNNPVWYCYLFLIEMIIVLLLYAIGLLLTRYIVRNYGKTFDFERNTIVKGGDAEDDTFIDRKTLQQNETSI